MYRRALVFIRLVEEHAEKKHFTKYILINFRIKSNFSGDSQKVRGVICIEYTHEYSIHFIDSQ